MSKTVVADSTCLIGLSRTGRLNLLRELFQNILIPPAVYDQVVWLPKSIQADIINTSFTTMDEVKHERA